MNVKSDDNSGGEYVCSRCDEKFTAENEFEGITAMCLICSKEKPVKDLSLSYPFPCVCKDCRKELSGEGKKSELAKCFNISESSIRFTSFVDVLKRPIS